MLIDTANTFRAQGMGSFEAVTQASIRRLRPILITSLTTFFGLAPMIFETSVQARFLIPMAISLGGRSAGRSRPPSRRAERHNPQVTSRRPRLRARWRGGPSPISVFVSAAVCSARDWSRQLASRHLRRPAIPASASHRTHGHIAETGR